MIELIGSLLLADFPSGSSINYHNTKLYLIGDDATSILVMNSDYTNQKTIRVFDFADKRIPKPEKADYETSTIVKVEGKEYLIVLGSASKKNRRKGILIELENQEGLEQIEYTHFIKRLKEEGVNDVNLEGCAAIANHFIFSNRANDNNPNNIFIVTSSDFWKNQEEAPLFICAVALPVKNETVIGISELCYVESRDLLLITLSSEVTSNTYDDGTIGDSYIGWIDSISQKINQSNLSLDGMLNLSDYHAVFKGEKIEGVCVESLEHKTLNLHLVSDNDQGMTRLFRIKMVID